MLYTQGRFSYQVTRFYEIWQIFEQKQDGL